MTGKAASEHPARRALVRYGDFVFRWRNLMFPLAMAAVLLAAAAGGGCTGAGARVATAAAGIALIAAGQALRVLVVGLAYIKRGGVDKRVYAADLVTGGMFAHCRNPLYVGNLLVAAGLLVLAGDPRALLVGIAFFASAYVAIVAAEERYLVGRFGEQYREYCARVPRWIPDPRGLGATLASMRFDWRRVIAKEYPSATTTIVATCAVLALRETACTGTAAGTLPVVAGAVAALAIAGAVAVRVLKKRGRLRESRA